MGRVQFCFTGRFLRIFFPGVSMSKIRFRSGPIPRACPHRPDVGSWPVVSRTAAAGLPPPAPPTRRLYPSPARSVRYYLTISMTNGARQWRRITTGAISGRQYISRRRPAHRAIDTRRRHSMHFDGAFVTVAPCLSLFVRAADGRCGSVDTPSGSGRVFTELKLPSVEMLLAGVSSTRLCFMGGKGCANVQSQCQNNIKM